MNKAVILIGHGATEAALKQYEKLLIMFRDRTDNAFLIMLHGEPSAESVADKVNGLGIKNVTLIPILLATGHHMEKNIISENSSIQQEFLKRNIDVEVINKGLLEYEQICEAIVNTFY